MMQTVTEPGGTATRAAILGYHVAGKTGTARKSEAGGYSRRYMAYFAGLVPVENPRFAMTVVINDPDPSRGGSTYGGGYVSAPLFARVMDGALRLMDVPPDDIETWLAAQAAAEARRKQAAGTARVEPRQPHGQISASSANLAGQVASTDSDGLPSEALHLSRLRDPEFRLPAVPPGAVR